MLSAEVLSQSWCLVAFKNWYSILLAFTYIYVNIQKRLIFFRLRYLSNLVNIRIFVNLCKTSCWLLKIILCRSRFLLRSRWRLRWLTSFAQSLSRLLDLDQSLLLRQSTWLIRIINIIMPAESECLLNILINFLCCQHSLDDFFLWFISQFVNSILNFDFIYRF